MDSTELHNNFYRAFEDYFRGSREVIRQRLEVYAPFLDELVKVGSANALDLGCGRGEWLELLRDKGFDALGVDLDDPMLEACREIGLNVKRADAIAELQAMADDSVSLISGFHIAEHLPFEQLQTLISEAHRVLKPGGLLILETPNPENVKVSTLTFFLDPTHKNPIPPALLRFMAGYYGFLRTAILRLQENERMKTIDTLSLGDVFFGVSPDYSIISQKKFEDASFFKFNYLFNLDYGIDNQFLFEKYDKKISKIEQFIAEERVRREALEQSLNALYGSISWKITSPLRAIAHVQRWLFRGARAWILLKPGSRPRRIGSVFITHLILWVRRRPSLTRLLVKLVRYMPLLEWRLLRLAHARGVALSVKAQDAPGVLIWHLDADSDSYVKWMNLLK